MKISVIGLGYIGLPTALLFAKNGHTVEGIDINERTVSTLNSGKVPFEEPGIEELFEDAKANFSAGTQLTSSDVYIIAVPTPLNKDMKIADLNAVRSASIEISKVIKDGDIVILESTVPPGTSRNFIIPILKNNTDKNIFYAHCPERAIPGNTLNEMVFNDRVIGGTDLESNKKVEELYRSFVKGGVFLTNVTGAEIIKLMENTYRDINIALANEFALICEELNINVWEAISLANKHPRVDILRPGPGVGGHCIAIDPLFIAEKSTNSKLVEMAREINDYMPIYVVKQVRKMVKGIINPRITLLGVAYKADVDDTRESPAYKILKVSETEGIDVRSYDPLVEEFPNLCSKLNEAVENSDCLIFVTDHKEFKTIDPNTLNVRTKNVLDTRNCIDQEVWKQAGFNVKLLGNGLDHES